MFRHEKPTAIARARALRLSATKHERRLWRELRMLNRNGYHFRHQAPFRGYILDFVEHSRKLIVELDGNQHGIEKNLARDKMRDKILFDQGYKILRFWNREVDESMDVIIVRIVFELEQRAPTRKSFAFSTSPQGGGAE
jgi:very-short-patch-repair endonuclease